MDQSGGEILISERILVNKIPTLVSFTSDGRIRWFDSAQRCVTLEKEVLGFTPEGSRIRIRAVAESGDGICCVGSGGALVRKDYVFEPLSDDSKRLWCQKLQEYIDSLGRPKSLFILMNPFGGKKSASKIFLDEVKPLLEAANIPFTLQETKYQLHAKEVAQALDLTKYDGIVCVSGDGILVEVVNGLLEREDWNAAIRMPVGVVPAGTGNGMVKSLLDSVGQSCSPFNAILAVIRGHKRSLDVATLLQGETRFFSVLMLAWGLVADIDIESEKYRWMGSSRLDFYALLRIIRLRKYNGHLSFVPAPGFESFGEPSTYKDAFQIRLNLSSSSQMKSLEGGYKGPNFNLENLVWRSIDGPFVSVWLHNVPWGSEGTMAAPAAEFSDGFLDLILIRDCPKLSLLSLMTELNNGNHVKSPYVLYLKVKALVLVPGERTEDPTKEGIIDSDGEVLARGKGTYKCDQKSLMAYDRIQITVDQGLATLFAPV